MQVLQVDDTGVSKALQLDDHESLLMSAWVRSGLWVQDALLEQLHVEWVLPEVCSRDSLKDHVMYNWYPPGRYLILLSRSPRIDFELAS